MKGNGFEKKTCTVPLSEHDCLFMYIPTNALVLVCRYFFKYSISSAKHRVPCDKNKGQELLPTAIQLVAGRRCTWCTGAVYRG